jgi:hydroxymethylglutaryl-CoA lyase
MITIREVGPRDGLQNVKRTMPLSAKKAWIFAEADAGVTQIEVGSFVPPALLPQLTDTAEVVSFALTIPNLIVSALVPNSIGAERAAQAGVHAAVIPFSMSETHSLKNVRKSHVAMIQEIKDSAAVTRENGIPLTVVLATAFGCSIEGPIDEDQVVRLAVAAMGAGADALSLADTTGYANPVQVKRLVRKLRSAVGANNMTTLHLHNTRGLGLANALIGLEEGIMTLDASLGGLGGCPFAPGASGNIVTEDLAFMLESMGVETGINLNRLIAVRQVIAEALPGEQLYGHVPNSGLPLGFSPR